jgi:hypothetical protein
MNARSRSTRTPLTTELLILPDGQVLVHNLTPAFARLLAGLNPDCDQIISRASSPSSTREHPVTSNQHPVTSIPHPESSIQPP